MSKEYPVVTFRMGDMADDLLEIKKQIERENPNAEVSWARVIRALLTAYKAQEKAKAQAHSRRIWK